MEETVVMEPDEMYHVYTRGNNRETIFRSKENYHYFLGLYKKYLTPYVDTFAYCLLPNHVHFLVKVKPREELKPLLATADATRQISISRQLGHLLNAYAKAYNNWHGRTDKLFQHRFKRKHVTSEAYFSRLVFYIHFNPQHHNLISDFIDWPYSSYHSLLSKSNTSLCREKVLYWFGGPELYQQFHQQNKTIFNSLYPLLDESEL